MRESILLATAFEAEQLRKRFYASSAQLSFHTASGKTGSNRPLVKTLLLMLWTAPTLRHRSAIGWLR